MAFLFLIIIIIVLHTKISIVILDQINQSNLKKKKIRGVPVKIGTIYIYLYCFSGIVPKDYKNVFFFFGGGGALGGKISKFL